MRYSAACATRRACARAAGIYVNYGLFSASAAASRLMGLDATATRHAMSIAGVSGLAMRQTRVGEISAWKGCAFANLQPPRRVRQLARQTRADRTVGDF